MTRLRRSFRCAFAGLAYLLRTEPNARIHAAATVRVAALALMLRLGRQDCCWLVLAATLVWAAEAMNSAMERLADRVCREQNVLIGHAKDLAASSVLCAAAGAAVIGLVILGPPLWAALAK